MNIIQRVCQECMQQQTAYCCKSRCNFTEYRCVTRYSGDIKKLLTNFKFCGKVHYGQLLASLLFRNIARMPFLQKIDFIIPVPMTAKKRIQRRYNQAEIIATHLSKKMQVYCMKRNLVKIKNTKNQSSLSKEQRKQNVRNVFHLVNKSSLYQKNILLIDDICTTGNTLQACIKALKTAKCKNIYIATIAYG
ncbi:ComF family protein [Candidatus Uabimicrobium sp. HlEnr_7]|uniref:ComF family protein n=1 Tax=Candidatus Uabimicrobium helgolandensis TaxID=3095367 RepID=UPI0035560980